MAPDPAQLASVRTQDANVRTSNTRLICELLSASMAIDNDPRPGITRWVQYDMPLFVRVQADADGEGTTISEVRLVVEDAYLTRDFSGHFIVYDEKFNQVADDKSEVAFDGYQRATTVTENRRDWPEQDLISLNEGWKLGPDPREDSDYYLSDEEANAKYADLFPDIADIDDE